MDLNIAGWIVAGGQRLEDPHAERDRAHLRALLESRRSDAPGLLDRLRGLARGRNTEADLVCCTA